VDPDVIVLGGGLCTKPHRIVEPVVDMVRRKLRIKELSEVPIRRSELWEDVVLYGAVGLVQEYA
jgi:hypothetical protein